MTNDEAINALLGIREKYLLSSETLVSHWEAIDHVIACLRERVPDMMKKTEINSAYHDEWRDIKTAPEGEMFIWAKPSKKYNKSWAIGLAYPNVSGTFSCTDHSHPTEVTHWMPLPQPPREGE